MASWAKKEQALREQAARKRERATGLANKDLLATLGGLSIMHQMKNWVVVYIGPKPEDDPNDW